MASHTFRHKVVDVSMLCLAVRSAVSYLVGGRHSWPAGAVTWLPSCERRTDFFRLCLCRARGSRHHHETPATSGTAQLPTDDLQCCRCSLRSRSTLACSSSASDVLVDSPRLTVNQLSGKSGSQELSGN